MYVCMYVCIYIYICVCLFIYIYVYLETRQTKAQVKKDNKLLKDLKFKKTQEENEELKSFVKSKGNDEEIDSSAEIEEVVEVRKKPKSKSKPKPRKRIVYVSDNEESDHSTDDEIVMKKPLKPKKAAPDTNIDESAHIPLLLEARTGD